MNNFDFCIYGGAILSKVPPVIRDTFTFPHPPSPDPCVELENEDKDKDVDYKNGLPVVPPESTGSTTLRCYRGHLPRVVAYAALKFEGPEQGR